jgi:site-specific DNA-methyltransferase (adenine-specific)
VKLFELMVQASAEPGFLVCDPFCGSGSSGVAALLTGCDFIGADVDARAVDIAEDRLTRFVATGQDPLEPAR